ncbi:MAPEG family protein [Bacteriovorax sp. Seq25_V]|uniref:MAPEG family protein n=1 Tax=Bacteriovorax sp. Seq25_V TaxID=1201288 RepID=UPI00038A2D12|nr:MAPEG family protein [Bacteriovorax sp. Seq25_V]EQC48017.1 MAPEG family protein [Bacteriovorax sp. Seq25_V]
MNQNLIYFPCLAMILLTAFVMGVMFLRRVKALKEKKVSMKHFRTYSTNDDVPELAIQAARNYTNLLETPTLFYVVCVFTFVMNRVDIFSLTMAWVFVALRIIHSYIHLTHNNVMHRMRSFALSWLIILILAIRLAF